MKWCRGWSKKKRSRQSYFISCHQTHCFHIFKKALL